MTAGLLTTVGMCLILGQASNEITYTKERNHDIPVNVQEARRGEIKELLLYASADQGRQWEQVARVLPDKTAFAFYANKDGAHWLRVALVTKAGVQEPDNRTLMQGPLETLKMVIDTLKPIVKSLQAQRDGDHIHVTWDVQEENFDFRPGGMKLEYQMKDAPTAPWTSISLVPGLKGHANFHATMKQAIVIRLTVRDLAGNESAGFAETAGTLAAAGFTAPNEAPPKNPNPPSLPQELELPTKPPPSKPIDDVKPPIFPLPTNPLEGIKTPTIPPPPVETSSRKPLTPNPAKSIAPPGLQELPSEKVVADTRTPPPIDPPKTTSGGIPPPMLNDGPGVGPVAKASPARKPLPPLQYVNNHAVTLEYELKRVGPSGIGGIELWLTKDDGDTWEQVADDEDAQGGAVQNRQQRKYEFRDNKTDVFLPDAVYGLTLVVKNRAGLGRKPRPGDVPEMRIEIDTQPPAAQLYKPVVDPQQPDHVLLRWIAEDRNLTSNPIALEFAERRDGPWVPIKTELENTGRFSWKVTNAIPVQVYLRLRVRDKAGNESIAVTAQPQYVDLMEPEGALIRVQPTSK